jgi:putative NADPH-quinone reductase
LRAERRSSRRNGALVLAQRVRARAHQDARMGKRILLVQGHPDDQSAHYGHALAAAYADGARHGGHEVRLLDVAALDFPLLRSKADWDAGPLPPGLAAAQEDIRWAQHVVLFFPLWLGGMPARLKGFFEQVARPGFALSPGRAGEPARRLLSGRSARVVVTMGMPAFVYRWFYRAHSVKALERNILGFVGFAPIRETLIGSVENKSPARRNAAIGKLAALGLRGR